MMHQEAGDAQALHAGELQRILDCRFRANPAYDLVSFERLRPEQQTALAALRDTSGFYGVLRPLDAVLTLKSVDKETALLLLTLGEGGFLPGYLAASDPRELNINIARMVLDAVLEIEAPHGFVSGAAARDLIYSRATGRDDGKKPTDLSYAALYYGQCLHLDDPLELSSRLYYYNRTPATAYWWRRFPDPGAVAQLFGLQPGGAGHSILTRHWDLVSRTDGSTAWLSWNLRTAAAWSGRCPFKLYLSPSPEYTGEAFMPLVETLTELQAPSFKVGRDVYGLLRPDKFVAYFHTKKQLLAVADRLSTRLKAMPAQGVPFTAPLDETGLLSWGMDPPPQDHPLPWQGPSWRRWVTDRLAVALIAARRARVTTEPWRYALERLELEGIDPATWTPSLQIWDKGAKPF